MVAVLSQPFDHQAFLQSVTGKPGVYQMLDAGGAVLYVGKAKNLKKTINELFSRCFIVKNRSVSKMPFAKFRSPSPIPKPKALLLEHNLIKQHLPPYNILLRDDKIVPYIYLSSDQDYPRLSLHRGRQKRKGRYLALIRGAHAVRESLKFFAKRFLKCVNAKTIFFRNRSRPCLQFQNQSLHCAVRRRNRTRAVRAKMSATPKCF